MKPLPFWAVRPIAHQRRVNSENSLAARFIVYPVANVDRGIGLIHARDMTKDLPAFECYRQYNRVPRLDRSGIAHELAIIRTEPAQGYEFAPSLCLVHLARGSYTFYVGQIANIINVAGRLGSPPAAQDMEWHGHTLGRRWGAERHGIYPLLFSCLPAILGDTVRIQVCTPADLHFRCAAVWPMQEQSHVGTRPRFGSCLRPTINMSRQHDRCVGARRL